MENLEILENSIHKTFDEIQIPFNPKVVLSVTIIRYKGLKPRSFFQKIFRTFKPRFHVSCPKLEHLKEFVTTTHTHSSENPDTCDVNETFHFVIPDDIGNGDFPLEIHLVKLEDVKDGLARIDVSKTALGKKEHLTIQYDKYHGDVEISYEKQLRENPDFRLGLGLIEEEKAFRLKRIPKVYDALQGIMKDQAPKEPTQTPIISVVGSGGGYRACVGMSGAMSAIKDAGLLDALTYVSGLSGSSWYLTTAYARRGVDANGQDEFHHELQKSVDYNLYDSLLDFGLDEKYLVTYHYLKSLFGQPTTFVDFYGYAVGHRLLGEKKWGSTLSELADYVKSGDVPFLTVVALHVKDTVASSDFHAYVENCPFEVSLPHYGIGFEPSKFGSVWNEGFEVRQTPESPLHYYQGMCGSAFAVLLKDVLLRGSEDQEQFLHDIDELRDRSHHEKMEFYIETDFMWQWFRRIVSKNLRCISGKLGIAGSRNGWLKRTAEIFNISRNYASIKAFQLNPFPIAEPHSDEERLVLEEFGIRKAKPMSTEDEIISIVDAGVLKNVCVEAVMRPQRTSDLVLVMDFNEYDSDSFFDYMPLLEAAKQSWQQGIRFPPVDFKTVVNLPPKELLVFESTDDECPTVMWFTLCNKKFRSLKDYKPPRGDVRKHEAFNDFSVFDKGSAYKTFHLHYNKYQFDRLHSLMYYNVSSNIEEIKVQIAKAVARKERRLSKLNNNL
ncbi:unnamed protein product [Clavelina lepadiformis]|uniref:PLA2c domain-containing protein n=1 Tax=Clavelina lepadiformis TaxID=159417 RepID=A0ABP0FQR5_CLALP